MSYRPTPETDKLWRETLEWCVNRDESHDPQHAALANLSERLERQRDELLESLQDCLAELSPLMQVYRPEHYDKICGAASAAIAKAKGTQ